GQPGLSRSRDILVEFLERSPSRQTDSRHARNGQTLRRRHDPVLLPDQLLAREFHRDRRRQPDSRPAGRLGARAFRSSAYGGSVAPLAAPDHPRPDRFTEQEGAGAGAPVSRRAVLSPAP